jgi:hypothetical protein
MENEILNCEGPLVRNIHHSMNATRIQEMTRQTKTIRLKKENQEQMVVEIAPVQGMTQNNKLFTKCVINATRRTNETRTRQERAQTRQQPAKRDSNATGFYRASFRKNPGFPYMSTR